MTSTRNPFSGMRRYPKDGIIAGVCQGIAVHFDWSPRLVRIIAVLLLIFTAFWPVVIAYLVAWYVLEPAEAPPPARGGERTAPDVEDTPSGDAPQMQDLKDRYGRLEERLRQVEACVTSEEFRLRRELAKLNS